MFTLAAWVVGHFSTDLKQMADAGAAGGINWVARGVYYLLPNLELFNARAGASHGVAVVALSLIAIVATRRRRAR